MFLGHHFTQLKNSNNLPVPSHWKNLIADGVYLTQGFDQNIMILTPKMFEQIYAKVSALNIADPLARLLQRMFIGTATYIEEVENETISLPQNLLGYANLESNTVIVGQGEYIEVWSSDLWQQQQTEMQDASANAGRFSTFTISIQA